MTDPTPTRADWETLVAHNKALIDRNVALRERAEAAEFDARELEALMSEDEVSLRTMLTESRRAEASAWNDAIEAAGNLESIHGYSNAVPRHRIRALRRAAPTEGEA